MKDILSDLFDWFCGLIEEGLEVGLIFGTAVITVLVLVGCSALLGYFIIRAIL